MTEIPEIIARAEMESWLSPLLKKRPWLAVSVGIARGGEQQLENFGACSPDSVFAIASLTKTFTALALARMVLDGTVRLDAPVREYLDALELGPAPYDEREITLLDLATHHSTLPRLPGNRKAWDFREPFADYGADDLYAALRARGLGVRPGAKYEYSNFGYGLLGFALARAAGKTFAELLDHYVCKPLGLDSTTPADPPALLQGHDPLGWKTPVWHFEDAMAGGGALRSTTSDVLRYLRAYLDPPEEFAEAMALVQKPVHKLGNGGSIGLGWHLNAAGIPWHNGALYGFTSYATFNPKSGIAYVVLANQYTPPHPIADETGMNIGRKLRGEPARPVRGKPGILSAYRHLAFYASNPLRRLTR